MAVRTREEIIRTVTSLTGENADDNTLSIIGDLTDTLNDYEQRVIESGNWRQRYEQNDADWRKRYKDRFLSPSPDLDDELGKPKEEPKKMTFDDLFKEE